MVDHQEQQKCEGNNYHSLEYQRDQHSKNTVTDTLEDVQKLWT